MEPCTLVYTLVNEKKLKFTDFYLLIRGMHNYMVESITPNPEAKNVHVKLGYQASVLNAQSKLGPLIEHIVVSKLSSFINEDEYSRLDYLRQKYGLPCGSDDNKYTPGPTRRQPVYKPRAAPYQKKAPAPRAYQPEPEPELLPNGGDSDQEVHDVE